MGLLCDGFAAPDQPLETWGTRADFLNKTRALLEDTPDPEESDDGIEDIATPAPPEADEAPETD